MATADGDAGDGAPVFFGQVARCGAEAASDVENGAILGERGGFEQEFDQVNLGLFFGAVGRLEETVVDMLTPIEPQLLREKGGTGDNILDSKITYHREW